MNGAVMTLARYHARQTIKRQLYAQGIKLAHVESREIAIAANRYIDDHPEVDHGQHREAPRRNVARPLP